ncbi:MAG: 30S ribosome-binding factor RbfA [Candidatus Omnitrophota bacterium]|nr:30S ribosome-binding factor RbfA [Candidatus Omnitrophota bacterium]
MSMRMEKVNREIRKQIMGVISKEMDDPLFDFLTVTRVDTTSDLRESKVYFSLLDESKYTHAQESLDKMSKFIRVNLGKKIRMKYLPELKFIADNSIRYSVDIHKKIEDVMQEDESRKHNIED